MDNLLIAINVVLPVVFIMLLGYGIRQKEMVTKQTFDEMNFIIFKVLFLFLMMTNVIQTELETALNIPLIIMSMLGMTLYLLIIWLIISRTNIVRNKKGALLQASFRSNFVLMGLPIIQNLYPNQDIGVTTIMIVFLVPFMNVMSVIILQLYSDEKMDIKGTMLGILKNPMIVGTFIGCVIKLSGIVLPEAVMKFLVTISSMTTPLALMILGGNVQLRTLRSNWRELSFTLGFKLILGPIILVTMAVLLGYRDIELATILILSGGPAAVSTFPMAVAAGQDVDLSSQAVATTTVLCVVSMIIWISILKAMILI